MTRLSFSVVRVGLLARNTVREAIRQRLFSFIALLAVLLVLASQAFRELNFGSSELKFVADFGFGAMAFFGAVLSIIATAQLFFSEIEQRTVLTLLSKPVWRAEFLAGKFVGVSIISASFCGLLTLLLMAVLWWRETTLMKTFPEAFDHGRAVSYAAIAGAGFAQWLKLALLSSLTILVASFARTQLFTSAAGFMILVICHLQFLAEDAANHGGSGLTHVIANVLSVSLPNFQLFDFSESIGSADAFAWFRLGRLALYVAMYVAAVGFLAAFAFRRREI